MAVVVIQTLTSPDKASLFPYKLISSVEERMAAAAHLFESSLRIHSRVLCYAKTKDEMEAHGRRLQFLFDALGKDASKYEVIFGKRSPPFDDRFHCPSVFGVSDIVLSEKISGPDKCSFVAALVTRDILLDATLELVNDRIEQKLYEDGFPFSPDSQPPPELKAYDDMLFKCFVEGRVAKEDPKRFSARTFSRRVLCAWENVCSRDVLHPYFLATLKRFAQVDSKSDLPRKQFLQYLVSCLAENEASADRRQVPKWFVQITALAHGNGLCDFFWQSLGICCDWDKYSCALDMNLEWKRLRSEFPDFLRSARKFVPWCHSCCSGFYEAFSDLLVRHIPARDPFTSENVSRHEIEGCGYSTRLQQALLKPDKRPFVENFLPSEGSKNGSLTTVERDAAKIDDFLQERGWGSAMIAGEARNWYIRVKISAFCLNEADISGWVAQAKLLSQHVTTHIAIKDAVAQCRDSILLLLCARWISPHEMGRAGLVPKELWVDILMHVWKSRRKANVWSTLQEECENGLMAVARALREN